MTDERRESVLPINDGRTVSLQEAVEMRNFQNEETIDNRDMFEQIHSQNIELRVNPVCMHRIL